MGWPLAADGALQLTNDNATSVWRSGFRRRAADGFLVAQTTTAGCTKQNGFLRDGPNFPEQAADGALCYNVGGAVAYIHHGFAFASDDTLCTTGTDPAPAYKHNGLKFDSAGRVYATVLA